MIFLVYHSGRDYKIVRVQEVREDLVLAVRGRDSLRIVGRRSLSYYCHDIIHEAYVLPTTYDCPLVLKGVCAWLA